MSSSLIVPIYNKIDQLGCAIKIIGELVYKN